MNRCPFCRCYSQSIREAEPVIEGEPSGEYYVLCKECDARGPTKDTREEAEAAWNTGTTPAGW